ncbi:DNA mismatch repair protein MutS [Thermoflexus sp.]|uniref:DNA mismatch repair protein MutS n=1 Tax=Thermoflexus sp. TaxID=1969742 RepID=UPI002ADD789E|nr:DNA mismatch repair protein MutS [Thermoflexus sp.]
MSAETPMLAQYRRIKARFPDAIVMFRLGDFYEMFEEDAKIAARELELALTSRSFSKDVRLPMAGVPAHHVDSYIGRLIAKGYKVAVVEQLEDPKKVKRLVKRDVVRVITPGTVVEEALLRDRLENYLAAIAPSPDGRSFGLAALDLSTGEFFTAQLEGSEAEATLLEELARLSPAELVLPESRARDEAWVARLKGERTVRISPLADAAFHPENARRRLLEHFGVSSLQPFGCEGLPWAIAAAGAALHYVKSSQISDLRHLRYLSTYHRDAYMGLDPVTRRNLELTETIRERRAEGSLFSVLNHTVTAMGARLLRRWLLQPLRDVPAIQMRLDAVEELTRDGLLRQDLRRLLDGLYDVERLVGRIGFGNANARDLVALKRTLQRIPQIRSRMLWVQAARLQALRDELDPCVEVVTLIDRAIVDDPPLLLREGGLIKPGYHEELDRLRRAEEEGRRWLAELEGRERARTGIENLRIRYNEIFGFFIEVPRSKAHQVPPDYERRATITHAERFVTPELKARETEILATQERIEDLEYELFAEVRGKVAEYIERLQGVARRLAELDVYQALAEAAARYGYTRPVVEESDRIEIREGRHPMVERHLPPGEPFVPNDAELSASRRLIILTGPNLSGKSVYIRQVALITLMAQMGSFVPARSARIGIADRLFARVGASDDITAGISTFLAEMLETAYILHHATPRSLVILDEVGRGTSTYDGLSLAWAVAEALHDEVQARVLFATHYHELTRLADHLEGACNMTMAVREIGDQVVFLRRVIPGAADKSYGIYVARLAGLPDRVIRRARQVLEELEGKPAHPELPAPRRGHPLARPEEFEEVRRLLWEILGLDLANTTPLQALLALNELQGRLRQLLQSER